LTYTYTSLVICDLDGVLANFTQAFSALVAEKFGTPILSTPDVLTWHWEKQGFGPEHFEYGWQRVEQIPNWWETLEPLATPEQFARINKAQRKLPIVFVTMRARSGGDSTFHQSIRWLEAQGVHEPLVIRESNKVRLAAVLNPARVIEDHPETAWGFAEAGIPVALIDWPYTEEVRHPYVTRCNLDFALDLAGA